MHRAKYKPDWKPDYQGVPFVAYESSDSRRPALDVTEQANIIIAEPQLEWKARAAIYQSSQQL